MIEIFGDYIENLPPGHDYLDIGFSANSRPIKHRWRNNRLSAYFVADYLSTFMPVEDEDTEGERRREECKSSVSYVANELLENAMKFHSSTGNYPIRFGIHFIENPEIKIVLLARNSITQDVRKNFQNFIQELISSDPSDLYILHLERNAEEENSNKSGLGFLTMINDYSAKIGWKFESLEDNAELMAVTTLVQLPVL